MAKTKDQKAERHQMILAELLKEEDNKYCADCGMKGKGTGMPIIITRECYILKKIPVLLMNNVCVIL